MKFDLKEDVLSLKVCVLGGYKWIVAKIAAKVKVLSFFCNRNGRWLMQNWSKWKMYASFGTILSKKSMDLATCYLVIGRCKTWTWLGKDLNASIRWCFWKKNWWKISRSSAFEKGSLWLRSAPGLQSPELLPFVGSRVLPGFNYQTYHRRTLIL